MPMTISSSHSRPLSRFVPKSANEVFDAVEAELARNSPYMHKPLQIERGIAALLNPALDRPVVDKISLARKLVELSEPDSQFETQLLTIWKNAQLEWATQSPAARVIAQLQKDTMDPESRFQLDAAAAIWDISWMRFTRAAANSLECLAPGAPKAISDFLSRAKHVLGIDRPSV